MSSSSSLASSPKSMIKKIKLEKPDDDAYTYTPKVCFNDEQKRLLTIQYGVSPYLTGVNWTKLTREIGLTKNQIKQWFNRKRSCDAGLNNVRQLINYPQLPPPPPQIVFPPPPPPALFSLCYNAFMQMNQYQNPIPYYPIVQAPMPTLQQFNGFHGIPNLMQPNMFYPYYLPSWETPVIKQEPIDNEE